MMSNSTAKQPFLTVRTLATVGMLAALVFAGSYIQIPLGTSRIHLGNVFCALSGLLFGPAVGGLASGIGSFLYDLIDPRYMAESWITFILKFVIGFLAGLIAHWAGKISLPRDILGSLAGSACYVVLYIVKNTVKMMIAGSAFQAALGATFVDKGIAAMINGALAVAAAVLLVQLIRPALRKAKILS